MTEQSLAVMFKGFAKEIKDYRTELGTLSPEVDERCKALDELVEGLERQAHVLTEQVLPVH